MRKIPIKNKEEQILYNRDERIKDYEKIYNDSGSKQMLLWIESEKNIKIGDAHSEDLAAPGCGKIHYEITRIDEEGNVWGICTSNHICELEISDVL